MTAERTSRVRVIKPKKIVKKLAINMELEGTVKRLTDFGAFVDIGVGRDGLVHVSEMSVRRISKPSDVVSVGDTIKVWIKDLDRAHNRISLTMIPPGTKRLRDLEEGEVVKGTVTRILPYAAFVDIGVGRDAMLHIREMSWQFVKKPEDVVKEGEEIEAKIIKLDKRRERIDLSLKALQEEPERQERPQGSNPRQRAEGQSSRGRSPRSKGQHSPRQNKPMSYVSEPDDASDEPTALALALKKALGDEVAKAPAPRRRKERRQKQRARREIDEIIARTLSYRESGS
ncbi:MAG: S1 RNA-binding domain-containing protein [Nitrospiraceae bacterium]|nr:S1 RNA-binding domain-containing protein [Nitrospiraceae bacterium]